MNNKLRKSSKIVLLIISFSLFSCVVHQPTPPPPEQLKVDLGRIGIVSACFQPEVRFQKPPTKGDAAWQGAKEWVAGSIAGGFGTLNPLGAILGVILAPVAAGVGGIVGSVKGVTSEEMEKIKEQEGVLNGYVATLNFQQIMRDCFLSVAREQTQYPFVPLEVQGPGVLLELLTYDSLSSEDIDTVLEIGVRYCELSGEEGAHPPLHLVMSVGTRYIRLKDGQVLYSPNPKYRGVDFRQFSDWAANSAQLFKEEVDRGFQFLAEEIVKRVFALQEPHNSQPSDVMKTE